MNIQQTEYVEPYRKRHNNSVVFNAIFLFGIIALRMLFFASAYSPANEARASVKKELIGPGFQLSIEINGEKKSISLDNSRYKDMEFSPSGRYLLVEAENGTEYQMYIFDTNFVTDSSQYYLIYDDLNMMAEWVFRSNDMLEIENDDTVSLEFIRWHQDYNYIKFDYKITHSDGNSTSGFFWLDYDGCKVLAVNEEI